MAFSARNKHDAASGLITLSYNVTPDVLIYGTYAHGGKSGGLNLTAAGVSNPVVKSEKVDSFEVGIKSQLLDRRLTFNAAAFHTDVGDYQAAILEQIGTSISTRSYIANIPKVRSRGFEADVNLAVKDWLNLSASAAYTDARYVVYTNAPQKTELALPGTLPIQDLSGSRVPAIPEFAYNLSIDASRPLGSGDDASSVYGRIDFSHRSATNVSNNNSKYGYIEGYGLVNARVGIRLAQERLDASLWVRNLTDKDYYVSRAAQAYGVISSSLGEPRTYGLTLRTKW